MADPYGYNRNGQYNYPSAPYPNQPMYPPQSGIYPNLPPMYPPSRPLDNQIPVVENKYHRYNQAGTFSSQFQVPVISNNAYRSSPNYYPPNHSGSVNFSPSYPDRLRGLVWVRTNLGEPFPPSAVHGGVDADGAEIFVGRAYHDGDLIPAKVIPGRHEAFICYGGREHMKTEFEVLCRGDLHWEPSSDGHVPHDAVPGGHTTDGETLYIGRAIHDGSQTVGKIQPSHRVCYISFAGNEIAYNRYEVLCLRNF